MTERRTLIREVLHYGPDGKSVSTNQSVEVQIEWPAGDPEPLAPDRRFNESTRCGEWRMLDKKK